MSRYVVPPLTREERDALDPGIRDVVVRLRDHGFRTTDSGDGASKVDAILTAEALPFPHVHMVANFEGLGAEVMRLRQLLPGWVVEVAYSSLDEHVILTVYRMDVPEEASS